MAKDLAFFFDGTMYSPDKKGVIFRLYEYLRHKDTPVPWGQHFYYSGVGTRSWSTLRNILSAEFALRRGQVQDILDDAGKDLAENYQPGDRIFLFGWSRGAAIARRFAAVLHEYLPSWWSPAVEAMFCIDTVAAVDGPCVTASDVEFTNGCTVASSVKKAFHFVSLHEQATVLTPTLMNRDDRVTEIWMAGGHGDLGGGPSPFSNLLYARIINYLGAQHPHLFGYYDFLPEEFLAPLHSDVLTASPSSSFMQLVGRTQRRAGVMIQEQMRMGGLEFPVYLDPTVLQRADQDFANDHPRALAHNPAFLLRFPGSSSGSHYPKFWAHRTGPSHF